LVLFLAYTPVGQWVPVTNVGFENRYGKQLVQLNRQMTMMMDELVRLKEYNTKLRKAMGEEMTPADSAKVSAAAQVARATQAYSADQTAAAPASSGSTLHAAVAPAPALDFGREVPLNFPAILPAQGFITRYFEPEKNHFGIDIAGKVGSPIVAAADGNVVFSGWTSDAGYEVILSHPDGFMTFYKHNATLLADVHAYIHRGEPIATLGNTGTTSMGPHVHFEVWKDGVPVDPSAYLLNLNM
jgi:murein DD-endopeptidase MepM/ murein hydrolase activator NlpD